VETEVKNRIQKEIKIKMIIRMLFFIFFNEIILAAIDVNKDVAFFQ